MKNQLRIYRGAGAWNAPRPCDGLPLRKRGSKYHNKPVVLMGIRFDSKAEARRYGDLVLLAKAGQITNLKVHPVYVMMVNGFEVCKYEADFTYWVLPGFERGWPETVTRFENSRWFVVEDVKGKRTAEYQLKKKLMWAVLGIRIHETGIRRR